jgi:hypothetical protein
MNPKMPFEKGRHMSIAALWAGLIANLAWVVLLGWLGVAALM